MNNAPNVTGLPVLLVLVIVQFIFFVEAYREHKVHNIVLYPDKHSWCKTTTIKQVISYPGCTSIEIDNNVCVGACFSYSIPHTEPSDPGEVIVPYCDSCQPSETTWHQITLQCSKNDADASSQLIKHVQIIQNCSCTSCQKNSPGISKFPDNNEDLFLQQSADPELLEAFYMRRNESLNFSLHSNSHLQNNERSKKVISLLNHKAITLLRNIQANNSDYDKEQLFDLFYVMQDPLIKHKIKPKNIIDFIENLRNNNINKTDFDIDTSILAEILLKFEYPKHIKIEMPHLTDDQDTMNSDASVKKSEEKNSILESSKIVSSTSGMNSMESSKEESIRKQRIPIAVWIQHPVTSDELTSKENHHLHEEPKDISNEEFEKSLVSTDHNIVSELEIESESKSESESESDSNSEPDHENVDTVNNASTEKNLNLDNSNKKSKQQPPTPDQVAQTNPESTDTDPESTIHHHLHNSHSHLHQKHHVNDNIIASHGHLARGPHGALVIEPDRIHEEKLDVNAHELKPNHGGTLLSYHSHSGEGNAR